MTARETVGRAVSQPTRPAESLSGQVLQGLRFSAAFMPSLPQQNSDRPALGTTGVSFFVPLQSASRIARPHLNDACWRSGRVVDCNGLENRRG